MPAKARVIQVRSLAKKQELSRTTTHDILINDIFNNNKADNKLPNDECSQNIDL